MHLGELYESDRASHQLVNQAILVLERNGPAEGRPLVDAVTGSKLASMKELRPPSAGRSEIRLLLVREVPRWASAVDATRARCKPATTSGDRQAGGASLVFEMFLRKLPTYLSVAITILGLSSKYRSELQEIGRWGLGSAQFSKTSIVENYR